MDFLVPAGIRLYFADGTICLPDEVRLQMAGKRPFYVDKIEHVGRIVTGAMSDKRPRLGYAVRRQTSISYGLPGEIDGCQRSGKMCYLQVTNIGDRGLTLHEGSRVAMWLSGDRIPPFPDIEEVRQMVKSRISGNYGQDQRMNVSEQVTEPAIAGDKGASPPSSKCTSDQGKIEPVSSYNLHTKIETNIGDLRTDDEVGPLFAEDVEDQLAVLPKVTSTMEEIKIEDLQISDAKIITQEEIERLVQII
ncbi:Hypothetical protein PHPALM_7162 [Phytophthora palmivora]|uniref:Uncharacterized protein n=1 Tax=Phytophthora palmivora TaxID=4796 RepID=A0A2P4YD16_9STRA|nr:Hypothetical protein PHPALM_7162 [Phytophthora palmivora]